MEQNYYFDRGIYYVIIGWVLTLIILIVIAIRLYSRSILTRSIGSDDFSIVVATCLSICGMIQDTLCVSHGLGKHESLLSAAQIEQVNRWSYIDWLIVFISFFFVRTSVMLFVLRLLPPNKRLATRIIFVTFSLNFAITMIACVSYGLSCQPFQAAWDTSIKDAKCLSKNVITITQQVNGILACLIDITTALIPQFLLWNIKMKRTTKLSLDIIFALGLITAGLSIGRVASMNHGVWETDTGWRAMNSDTFSMVEEKCGIIFASGPAIRQFIAYYRRVGTFAPTKKRQRPEEDFVGFRRRVNLRDIFWYRQAPVTNGRVLRPQQMFHPPTSDVSSANQSLGEKDVKIADKKAQRSMLDRLTGRAKRDGSPTDSNVSSNMSSGKTKLWNWSMRSTEHSGDRTESSDSGGERIWPGQDKSVRVDQEYGYDVEATPRTILPTDDVPYIESLANPSMEQRRLQITRNLQG